MRTIRLCLVLSACLSAGVAVTESETAFLVRDAEPVATVVLPADSAPELADAAAELSRCVEKLCGAALPVKADGEAVGGTGIYLGQCAGYVP